jgi:uncharacterized RDD family membrane protein YckC
MAQQQPPVMPAWQAAPPVRPGPAVGVAFAGFWIRVVAMIIDSIAVGVLTSAVTPLLGFGWFIGQQGAWDPASNAFGALVGLAYFVGLWTWKGQTLGMMPFGLWVVREEDGGMLDLTRALLRYVGLIVSFAAILLGVIWVAFDARKQGWHDKMARSLVIRRVA